MANKTYTTVAKVENYLLTEIDPSFESQVTAWIEGVSRMMERMTGREFSADATGSARYYDGRGADTLLIDDALEVSAVEVGDFYGENFAAITDFVKKGTPIRKLIRKGVFDEGHENVKVTAKWGYPATTPPDIELCCTILVAGIINNQNKGKQAVKSEKLGEYQVTYHDEKGLADYNNALAILNTHKRILF